MSLRRFFPLSLSLMLIFYNEIRLWFNGDRSLFSLLFFFFFFFFEGEHFSLHERLINHQARPSPPQSLIYIYMNKPMLMIDLNFFFANIYIYIYMNKPMLMIDLNFFLANIYINKPKLMIDLNFFFANIYMNKPMLMIDLNFFLANIYINKPKLMIDLNFFFANIIHTIMFKFIIYTL